jgi:hypothetical protein
MKGKTLLLLASFFVCSCSPPPRYTYRFGECKNDEDRWAASKMANAIIARQKKNDLSDREWTDIVNKAQYYAIVVQCPSDKYDNENYDFYKGWWKSEYSSRPDKQR